MQRLLSKMDIPLFIITIVFCILGLIMIYSSSSVSAVILYDYSFFFSRVSNSYINANT